jgi:hypothetical protein
MYRWIKLNELKRKEILQWLKNIVVQNVVPISRKILLRVFAPNA